MTGALVVRRAGPLCLIEDRGRPGLAQIGVGASGAADRGSYELANRLVGNVEGAATLELTLGGLEVVASGADLWISLTGAPAPMHVDGRAVPAYSVELLRDGALLTIGTPEFGLRSYLAVRGGVDATMVLGSRSHDVMSEIGPPPLREGDTVPIGTAVAAAPLVDQAPPPMRTDETVLRVVRGPRDSHVAGLEALVSTKWAASPQSNRIGVRLDGARLGPMSETAGHLPSEGAWRGAVQVPPGGQPVVFLADHPVTGGYPVVGVVIDADVDRAAQLRPGQSVRFAWTGTA